MIEGRSTSYVRASLVFIVVILGCSIFESNPPGTSHGTFLIHGDLIENECGSSAVPALDPLVFSLELRSDGELAYYKRTDAPLAYGVVRRGEWKFQSRELLPVYGADPTIGRGACSLQQHEKFVLREIVQVPPSDAALTESDAAVNDAALDGIDANVSSKGQIESLEGETVITFSPSAGSDCSASRRERGGPFLTLPCTIRYALSADRSD